MRPARPAPARPDTASAAPLKASRAATWFPVLMGSFLAICLLKFGNPPIMEKWVTSPKDIFEFILGSPWPIGWAYTGLVLLVAGGVALLGWRFSAPRWLLALPLVWILWQGLAATRSIAPELSWPTFGHFVAVAICFYAGLAILGRVPDVRGFWLALLAGFGLVLASGWSQQFGGLEETRRYFFLYIYPQMPEVSPDYLKKISSNRIFATLFYPNALAGVILLLTPALLLAIWNMRDALTAGARAFLVAAVGLGALCCLYWSGSKGGWLLMLLAVVGALLRFPLAKSLRVGLVVSVLLAGAAGFVWKYAGFFQRGASSVSARFDYWEAAAKISAANPLFGTGPGTFGVAYAKIKRPESEPSRLTHNDYLEQACDSGWPGFLAYLAFVAGALFCGFPGNRAPAKAFHLSDEMPYAAWLGVLTWSLQSVFEFGLYIPALAWPAFTILGWLVATGANAEMRHRVAANNLR